MIEGSSLTGTITNSGADVTISTGDGNDTIKVGANFTGTTERDTIEFNGSDWILSFGSDSLTIADAANSSITFVEEVNVKRMAVTLNAATSMLISIDDRLASGTIEIVGNSKANKIFAGDHTVPRSTAGNGTIGDYGNGSDTFIYSAGKDVIYNFGDGETYQISGSYFVKK